MRAAMGIRYSTTSRSSLGHGSGQGWPQQSRSELSSTWHMALLAAASAPAGARHAAAAQAAAVLLRCLWRQAGRAGLPRQAAALRCGSRQCLVAVGMYHLARLSAPSFAPLLLPKQLRL
jgi:hypothetical protein